MKWRWSLTHCDFPRFFFPFNSKVAVKSKKIGNFTIKIREKTVVNVISRIFFTKLKFPSKAQSQFFKAKAKLARGFAMYVTIFAQKYFDEICCKSYLITIMSSSHIMCLRFVPHRRFLRHRSGHHEVSRTLPRTGFGIFGCFQLKNRCRTGKWSRLLLLRGPKALIFWEAGPPNPCT